MIVSFFRRFKHAFILLLIQCLILSRVNLLGYATPMPYILFILTFQLGTDRMLLLVSGFLLGLAADIFTNTPGISAASCTLLALVQPSILRFMAPRDIEEDLKPSYKTLGFWGFVRYATAMTLLFQFAYYLILAFSLAHPLDMVINMLGGTLFTLILIIPLESFFQKKEKKVS